MPLTDKQLQWENRVVLTVVQALLGLASPGLDGVSVDVRPTAVTIHLSYRQADQLIDELVEDLVSEVEAWLWPEPVSVDCRVHIGSPYASWAGRDHRLVVLSRPSAADEADIAAATSRSSALNQ